LQFYSDKECTSAQGFNIIELLNCAGRCDLFWGINTSAGYNENRQLFIMRQKGVSKKIFSLDCNQDFGQAAFDGKLAWIPITGIHSRILAIDPETENIIEFSEIDGLPTPISRAVTAPAGAWSVFLSAAISGEARSRAFLANLRIDAGGAKKIQLIHEASRQLRTDIPLVPELQMPDLEYQPLFMIAKPGNTPDSWQVAIGRNLPGASGLNPVLLVETKNQNAVVSKASVESHITGSHISYKDHNAYWIANGSIRCLTPDNSFFTASNSIMRPEAGTAPEEAGNLFYTEGRWYVIGKDLWVTDEGLTGPWRKLGTSVSVQHYYQELFSSSFYGILLHASVRGEWKLFQIDVLKR
jgi:hypothetical protein